MTNFNLVWPTRAAAARSHLQHVPDSDAAQNRPVRSLQRVVRKMSGRPLFGHVNVTEAHKDHADRAYWQCYSQGHFPGDPRRIVTVRRHFLTRDSRLLCASSTVPTCPYRKHRREETLISIVMASWLDATRHRALSRIIMPGGIFNPRRACTLSLLPDARHVLSQGLLTQKDCFKYSSIA